MKTLSLIRHAKSSWKYQGLDDVDRPLNKRGRVDAPFMAERFAKRAHGPDLLFSSFANRAFTTARIFAAYLDYPIEKLRICETLYEASVQDLLALIEGLDDQYRHVALFGHNPGLTQLCNRLCDAQVENIPTSGIAIIDLDVSSWGELSTMAHYSDGCRLVTLDYPKRHRL